MSKKIDWTKPIRWVEGFRYRNHHLHGLTVVYRQHGNAVVAGDYGMDIVDSEGCRNGEPFIENVPEELYLRLFRHSAYSPWQLDAYNSEQALPRDLWAACYQDRMEDENHILVKVPS
jgi:hypothetical protein